MGVKVNFTELSTLVTELNNIVDEFEHAGGRRRDLQGAVGKPYGESDLHDAADDFEGRWDDRRKNLMENCKALAEHVDGVVKGFQGFDEEAASKFEENS